MPPKTKQSVPRREGHEWLISSPTFGIALEAVEQDKGILRGVAIMTEGEVKGHGYFADADFVEDVISHGNANTSGLKARFGHPAMSGTALGTFLGRAKNFRRDDHGGAALARADLFLSNSASDAPGGDLKGYILKLAADDPEAFGMSIVFERDGFYRRTPDGKKVKYGDDDYQEAPAKDYIALKKLHAADAVDDPAANPDGLFSAWNGETFAAQVTEFLDTHPEVFDLVCQHPETVDQFMARYRAYRERKENAVNEESEAGRTVETADAEVTTAAEAVVEPDEKLTIFQRLAAIVGLKVAVEPETPTTQATPATDAAALARKAAKPYIEAFGEQGSRYFLEGKSMLEAGQAEIERLQTELGAKDTQLAQKDEQKAELQKKLDAAAAAMGSEQVVTAEAEEPDPAVAEREKLVKLYTKDGGLSQEDAEAKADQIIAARESRRQAE